MTEFPAKLHHLDPSGSGPWCRTQRVKPENLTTDSSRVTCNRCLKCIRLRARRRREKQ